MSMARKIKRDIVRNQAEAKGLKILNGRKKRRKKK